MKLFQVYERRYDWDQIQVRLWRTRLFYQRWPIRGGWKVGLSAGSNGLVMDLLVVQVVIVFWSHEDDCDCPQCVPF